MRQKIFTYTIIGILSILTFGCEKDEVNSDEKVELFLLDSYSKIENSFQIDETTVKTKASPLISYSDFISYDSVNYEFQISDKAKNAIDEVEHSVFGVAFAVKANGILIYSGYFWPSYSSASCDCIVIDPMMTSVDDKIKVSLGYPGLIQGQVIPDNRNDSRIIMIFEKDNKLIK
ncbi:MAG: hypothetical protein PHO94_04970 [Petrimonas sp.]|nr:hypothetical protein [Petrimonas sp.]